MMARATLFLACLASRVAGQAKEPSQYDGDVAALCTSGDVRVTNGTFTLLQTGPTTVTVSVPASAAAANAVWISDAYGTVLDYTGSPTGTDIFTMPEGINDVKAHAAMGCMRVSDPTTFLTWQGLVDTFQSGNYDGFGGGGWSQSQIEEANLTLSADYATRASLPPRHPWDSLAARLGLAWLGLAWLGLAWLGLARLGLAWPCLCLGVT